MKFYLSISAGQRPYWFSSDSNDSNGLIQETQRLSTLPAQSQTASFTIFPYCNNAIALSWQRMDQRESDIKDRKSPVPFVWTALLTLEELKNNYNMDVFYLAETLFYDDSPLFKGEYIGEGFIKYSGSLPIQLPIPDAFKNIAKPAHTSIPDLDFLTSLCSSKSIDSLKKYLAAFITGNISTCELIIPESDSQYQTANDDFKNHTKLLRTLWCLMPWDMHKKTYITTYASQNALISSKEKRLLCYAPNGKTLEKLIQDYEKLEISKEEISLIEDCIKKYVDPLFQYQGKGEPRDQNIINLQKGGYTLPQVPVSVDHETTNIASPHPTEQISNENTNITNSILSEEGKQAGKTHTSIANGSHGNEGEIADKSFKNKYILMLIAPLSICIIILFYSSIRHSDTTKVPNTDVKKEEQISPAIGTEYTIDNEMQALILSKENTIINLCNTINALKALKDISLRNEIEKLTKAHSNLTNAYSNLTKEENFKQGYNSSAQKTAIEKKNNSLVLETIETNLKTIETIGTNLETIETNLETIKSNIPKSEEKQ
ncbi:MAG: hypothetical protein HQK65_16140 [Desulfamplus sp.]|nr:hypothetical protein [Desulfamplus sp.]